MCLPKTLRDYALCADQLKQINSSFHAGVTDGPYACLPLFFYLRIDKYSIEKRSSQVGFMIRLFFGYVDIQIICCTYDSTLCDRFPMIHIYTR